MEDLDSLRTQFISEAWRIIGELVNDGRAKLKGGKTVAPDDESLVRHYQWLAGLEKPRKKVALPEDTYKPKETI